MLGSKTTGVVVGLLQEEPGAVHLAGGGQAAWCAGACAGTTENTHAFGAPQALAGKRSGLPPARSFKSEQS